MEISPPSSAAPTDQATVDSSEKINEFSDQKPPKIYTIGIAGGSGAGKSTVARKVFQALGGAANVTYLLHDSYYRDQSHKEFEERCRTNYDHPDALETELMLRQIRDLKAGKIVEVPTYDFATHNRAPNAVQLAGPRPILLVEGILILCEPELVKEMDLTVYVDASPDVRIIRRMSRDCNERGRTVDQVVEQYHSTVRPMHEKFVEPCKSVADLIIHSSPHSLDRLDLVCSVLTNHLKAMSGIQVEKAQPALPIPIVVGQIKEEEADSKPPAVQNSFA